MEKVSVSNNIIQLDNKFLNALAEAFRLHEAIISETDLCIITTSNDGIITSFNRSAENLLGYTANEVTGQITPAFFHLRSELEKVAHELSQELKKSIEPGFETLVAKVNHKYVADRREWTYVTKEGKQLSVSLSLTPLLDEIGNIFGYAAIAADITEQKKIEKRITESEAHLQALVSSLDDIVFELDENGRFNKVWVKSDDFLFLPREAIYGKTLTEMFGEEFAKPFEEGFQSVLRTGETFNREYKTFHADQEEWFNAKYSLIYENGERTNRVSVCIQNITARKKAELSLKESEEKYRLLAKNMEVAALELQEQNQQLDEFAHIISHNLRSPVGNIKALINLLDENSSIEDYRMIFEKLKNVSNNLNETMNELMETLKVKKNTDIERVELRFKDILDKVVQSLEGELIACNASVNFDFDKAPTITYSKPYLESILQNLISNAIKYRSPKRIPAIHISTNFNGNSLEMQVVDNGLGMDLKKYGHKLFGLHKTFHQNTEARGVGLFLTKTQVEALGGSISAESEVDKGTTFIIRF